MTQNIVEYLREMSVNNLFGLKSFDSSWPTWHAEIQNLFSGQIPTRQEILDIGDHLREVFSVTGQAGRSQSSVSVGGVCWEAIVCWYLNLCTVNRRTVVIRHNKGLIPEPIADAITVTYGNSNSNTESDLIAITFPDERDYTIDKDLISINAAGSTIPIPTYKTKRSKYNYKEIINALVERDFNDIEVHIIQCKTNWNDNAQIPMLWDAVYQAGNFRNGISVGINGKSIHYVKRFTYSFVTLPSNQLKTKGKDTFKTTSTSVLRVLNLSGGNYWGLPSKSEVASSVKELVSRNLQNGYNNLVINTIGKAIPQLNSTFNYFKL